MGSIIRGPLVGIQGRQARVIVIIIVVIVVVVVVGGGVIIIIIIVGTQPTIVDSGSGNGGKRTAASANMPTATVADERSRGVCVV